MEQCKKCLLGELSEDAYRNIFEYIDAIEPHFKCGQDEYSRRLSICKNCDWLLSGVCQKCGCYVEVRAAKLGMRCPDVNKYW